MMKKTEALLDAAMDIARKGGEKTLEYFRKDVEVISKQDDSPVTIADREAEQVMRRLIERQFPEHGIIGEEFGTTKPDASVKWILDPIDGTVGFIHGIPLYTTLIGVMVNDKPTVGVIYAPLLNEMVSAAAGHGCFYNNTKTTIRNISSLEKASLMTSDVQYFNESGYKNSFEHLLTRVKTHRTWGDAYGYMMVATGRADIMMDPVLQIWDAAALLPVISEAGGSFTDLNGNARVDGGNGFACHPDIKEELLTIFKSRR